MPALVEKPPAVALLEIYSLGAALVVLDRVEKAAVVQVLQAELNDYYGLFLKLSGDVASVRLAVESARELTQAMGVAFTARALSAPDPAAWAAIESAPVVITLLLGLPLAIVFTILVGWTIFRLVKGAPLAAWIGTSAFLLTSLSNNTLSSKTPVVTIIVVLLVAFAVPKSRHSGEP